MMADRLDELRVMAENMVMTALGDDLVVALGAVELCAEIRRLRAEVETLKRERDALQERADDW